MIYNFSSEQVDQIIQHMKCIKEILSTQVKFEQKKRAGEIKRPNLIECLSCRTCYEKSVGHNCEEFQNKVKNKNW